MTGKEFIITAFLTVVLSCSGTDFDDLINREDIAYNSVVPAPTLYNPANGSINGSRTPTFRWNKSIDGAVYKLIISDKNDLSNVLVSQDDITGEEYTLSGSQMLPENGVFYWTVTAKFQGKESTRPLYIFTIDTSIPVISTSVDVSEVYPDKTFNLSFTVNKTGSYIIYKSKFSDFQEENLLKAGTIASDSVGKVTTLSLNGEDLFTGGINYLKLRFTDQAGNEGISSVSITRREYSVVSASITSPGYGTYIQTLDKDGDGSIVSNTLILEGSAKYDNNTPIVNDEYFTWSSDRQGYLGTGRHVVLGAALQPGDHKITLTVNDTVKGYAVAESIVHAPNVYTEDFSTNALFDSANSTGMWDTKTQSGYLGKLFEENNNHIYTYSSQQNGVYIASDNYILVTNKSTPNNILTFDVANKKSIVLKNTFTAQGAVNDVFIQGNYAYIANGTNGLIILDVTDPENPILKSTLPTNGEAIRITVSGSFAYLYCNTIGMVIVDVSDPSIPVLKGTYDCSDEGKDIAVKGDFVYLIIYSNNGNYGWGTMLIIDIKDPMVPVISGSYSTGRDHMINCIEVSGNYAFLGVGLQLEIFDISNPDNIISVCPYTPGGSIMDISITGNLAFLANHASGVSILDISKPSEPIILENYKYGNDVWAAPCCIATSLNYAYIADSYYGLLFFRTLYSPVTIVGSLQDLSLSGRGGLFIEEDYAYISSGANFYIVNVNNPSNPYLISKLVDSGLNYNDIIKKGNVIYALHCPDTLNLQTIDVSNPSDPLIIETLQLNGFGVNGAGYKMDVNDSFIYIASCSTSGLIIVNISNPKNPILDKLYVTPGAPYAIQIKNNFAYIADYDKGLLVLNINDPENPTIVSSTPLTGCSVNIALFEHYAVLAQGSGGLVIVDVNDPANPQVISSINSISVKNLSIENNLIITGGTLGKDSYAIDISNPSEPSIISKLPIRTFSKIISLRNYSYLCTAYDFTIMGNPVKYSELYKYNDKQKIQSKIISNLNVKSARIFTEKDENGQSLYFTLSNGNGFIPVGDMIRTTFDGIPAGLFWGADLLTTNIYETPLIRKIAIEYWE